jgi:ABC-type proline/glycine betaine transport system permease subunit
MVRTSQAALYSIAGIISSTVLGSVCGHAIDITNLDYVALGGALIAMFADMYKRRNQMPPGTVVSP